MTPAGETVLVIGFVVVSLLLLAGPLALVFGVDSRVDEGRRPHLPR